MSKSKFCRIGIVGKPFIGECSDAWNKNVIVNGNLNSIIYEAGLVPLGIMPVTPEKNFNLIDESDDFVLSVQDKEKIIDQLSCVDGVILQGGMQTLAYEEFIARYAMAKQIPIMGICAGFNTIVRVCGGTIIKNPTSNHECEPDEFAHSIIVDPESNFFRLMKGAVRVEVNSVHWMIAPIRGVPRSLKVAAVSSDKLVEVVEGREGPIFGYKFHPEVMAREGNKTYDPRMKNVFDDFFDRCIKYHNKKAYKEERTL